VVDSHESVGDELLNLHAASRQATLHLTQAGASGR